MKKIISFVLASILVIACFAMTASAATTEITIDNKITSTSNFSWGKNLVQVYTPDFGATIGDNELSWQFFITAEFDAAKNAYVVTNANLARGTAEGAVKTNTAIPANGFGICIGSNSENDDASKQNMYRDILVVGAYITLDTDSILTATKMTVSDTAPEENNSSAPAEDSSAPADDSQPADVSDVDNPAADTSSTDGAPDTGDSSLAIYAVLAVVTLAGAVIVVRKKNA